MTNQQLYLAIGLPVLLNFAGLGLLIMYLNSRISSVQDGLQTRIHALQSNMEARFAAMDQRFTAIDNRFDDMRDLWRSELHRVEEVIDARLKHLEER